MTSLANTQFNNSQVEDTILRRIIAVHEANYAVKPLFGPLVGLLAFLRETFPTLTIAQFNHLIHGLKAAGIVSTPKNELISLTYPAYRQYVVKDDHLPREIVHFVRWELQNGKSEQEIIESHKDFKSSELTAEIISKAKELEAASREPATTTSEVAR
jgi:hypothetical protein